MARSENHASPAPSSRFVTTHWSLVQAAGRGNKTEARRALVALCEAYWYPLYAYVRRRGCSHDQAQDLTQEFFARLLEKNYVGAADRLRGKFRSFLLGALQHFLSNEWRKAGTKKRGGRQRILSLDFSFGASQYAREVAHDLTPERLYERRWAFLLVERSLAQVRRDYEQRGQLALFESLKAHLGGDAEAVPYPQLAASLGISAGSVKVAVHRLRRRCREALREQIAQTVSSPEEIDEELQQLFQIVGR
jgi:RNA polymerase sigma-70 factor (ECF subfamily)